MDTSRSISDDLDTTVGRLARRGTFCEHVVMLCLCLRLVILQVEPVIHEFQQSLEGEYSYDPGNFVADAEVQTEEDTSVVPLVDYETLQAEFNEARALIAE